MSDNNIYIYDCPSLKLEDMRVGEEEDVETNATDYLMGTEWTQRRGKRHVWEEAETCE